MNERRRFPRVCPHCFGQLTPGHLRDTGEAVERSADACPALWAMRHHPSTVSKKGGEGPESIARLLGELIGHALNDALSPFGHPPRGRAHCHCGPTGHSCVLRATLRWHGRQYQWGPDGWGQL